MSSKLPKYSGTIIAKNFIDKRLTSWQAHLERISTFIECGQGIWWDENEGSYNFYDSYSNADCHPEGPTLMHYRESYFSAVETVAKEAWKRIIHNKTALPTPSIKLFEIIREQESLLPSTSRSKWTTPLPT